jgi:hypothetical protein
MLDVHAFAIVSTDRIKRPSWRDILGGWAVVFESQRAFLCNTPAKDASCSTSPLGTGFKGFRPTFR